MKGLIAVLVLLMAGLGTSWGAAADSPAELVKENSRQLLEALRENREALNKDPSLIYNLVDDIVVPHFDFQAMSQWVLGRYWRQATPEQRSRFVEEFRTFLVRNYATALLEYSGEEIHFPPTPAVGDNQDVTVRSEIRPRRGPAIPVNYSMHLKEGEWKVYDVTIEGVSQVITYRGTFADMIRRDGMDGLINTLADRNAQLAQPEAQS